MKHQIILWLGAAIITFLSGYVESVTNPFYPVTGTIGIDGKKLSYKFDRTANAIDGLEILLRTDVDSLNGYVEYRIYKSKTDWQKNYFESSEKTLRTKIKIQNNVEAFEYRVRIFHKDRTLLLQNNNQPVLVAVKGKVPGMINSFFYLLLFGGLLFSSRTALDFFNDSEKIKKLSLLTFILFCSSVIVFLPLKKIYEMHALGSKVLPIGELTDASLLIITIVWLTATVLIFNTRDYKIIPMIAAIITLILFQLNCL